ncbi:unnamed protein product [Owenia fusiformis]|uniref:Uncharacterized protein n=1 Tax=Owenia fusiformis TaxID=6347 RepID=A0A8J1UY96_OWEFU|nr:unnamed protein product [Owenia fusiformis]
MTLKTIAALTGSVVIALVGFLWYSRGRKKREDEDVHEPDINQSVNHIVKQEIKQSGPAEDKSIVGSPQVEELIPKPVEAPLCCSKVPNMVKPDEQVLKSEMATSLSSEPNAEQVAPSLIDEPANVEPEEPSNEEDVTDAQEDIDTEHRCSDANKKDNEKDWASLSEATEELSVNDDIDQTTNVSLPRTNHETLDTELHEPQSPIHSSPNLASPLEFAKRERNLSETTQNSQGTDSPGDHMMTSVNSDAASEVSNDSGKGASMPDASNLPNISENEPTTFEFDIPTDFCGMLIGRQGRSVKQLKFKSGANILVRSCPLTPEKQIVTLEGSQSEIDHCLDLIRQKFPHRRYPEVTLEPTKLSTQPQGVVLPPEMMQLGLPEGVTVDTVVSNIVQAGHVFLQQPTHPTFPSLERLNHCMIACYTQDGIVPQLPRPIEVGVICAAPLFDGWFRCQVVAFYEETDDVDIKYVDYGGYATMPSACLKQIRSDFTTLPFQASECYMANICPLEGEEAFSLEAGAVLEELTSNKLLQCQIMGRAEDSIPYIHLYIVDGHKTLFVNRELVNRGVARWIEQQ